MSLMSVTHSLPNPNNGGNGSLQLLLLNSFEETSTSKQNVNVTFGHQLSSLSPSPSQWKREMGARQPDEGRLMSVSTTGQSQEQGTQSPTTFGGGVGGGGESNGMSSSFDFELHPTPTHILGLTQEEEDDDEEEDSSSSTSVEVETDRPHSCSVCQRSYKTKNHLRRHKLVHNSSRPFSCRLCSKGFNRKENLNKHMEAMHSTSKHQCPYCNREMTRLDHMKRHIKSMHTSIKSKKENYAAAALLKVNLAKDLKSNSNPNSTQQQLSFLTQDFSLPPTGETILPPIPTPKDTPATTPIPASAPSMTIIPSNLVGPGQGIALAVQSTPTQKVVVHQRIPSDANINFQTVTSGLAGLASLSLTLGQQSSSSSSSSQAPSNTSSTYSSSNGEGAYHRPQRKDARRKDKSGGGRVLHIFNCDECSASFRSEKELAGHTRKVHKPQPHRCPECPRKYTRREKLTEHIRCVHQGQKFTCDYCGKNLSRKDHVLRHIRSIHPEVYAATFAGMDDNNVVFDEKGRLVKSDDPPDQNNRVPTSTLLNIPSIGDVGVLLRSVCHVCLKVFGTAYHLTRHVESCHNGDTRPFKCPHCLKKFKRKDHLTKHSKAHCPKLKDSFSPSLPPSASPLDSLDLEDPSSGPFEGKSCETLETFPTTHLYDQADQDYDDDHEDHHNPLLNTSKESSCSSFETSCQSQSPSPAGDEIESQLCSLQRQHQVDVDMDVDVDDSNLSNLLPEDTSTDCTHMLLQNLQVELDQQDDAHSHHHSSHHHHHHHPDPVEPEIRSIPPSKISSAGLSSEQEQPEFSMAVIDSFIQGSVNVVVVDDEISSFLRQSSASHMTTTFPCGQCQKEFSARDLLIAHLQEHENYNDNAIQNDGEQRISDISFSDF